MLHGIICPLGGMWGKSRPKIFHFPSFPITCRTCQKNCCAVSGSRLSTDCPSNPILRKWLPPFFVVSAHIWVQRDPRMRRGTSLAMCGTSGRIQMIQTPAFIKPTHGKVSIPTAQMSSRLCVCRMRKRGVIAFWSVPRRFIMKCVRHGLTYWHCCLIRLQ